MVGGENSVEQGRFARAEETGEHGDGDSVIVVFGHALEIRWRLFSKVNNRALSSQRGAKRVLADSLEGMSR
jgi:hypothetical protein